jgi:hypothetical protein
MTNDQEQDTWVTKSLLFVSVLTTNYDHLEYKKSSFFMATVADPAHDR